MSERSNWSAEASSSAAAGEGESECESYEGEHDLAKTLALAMT
jgi:hypothetical protein